MTVQSLSVLQKLAFLKSFSISSCNASHSALEASAAKVLFFAKTNIVRKKKKKKEKKAIRNFIFLFIMLPPALLSLNAKYTRAVFARPHGTTCYILVFLFADFMDAVHVQNHASTRHTRK